MTATDVGVFGTIAVAVVAWAVAETAASRTFWTVGALLATVHSVIAFGVFYGWSHETARVLTMRQTAQLTGLEFPGGIYVNYVFLTVWLADATWWWASRTTYESRPTLVSIAVRGFIFFIILNGAVIFADGWANIVGVASTGLVMTSWLLKRSSHRGASTTAG